MRPVQKKYLVGVRVGSVIRRSHCGDMMRAIRISQCGTGWERPEGNVMAWCCNLCGQVTLKE